MKLLRTLIKFGLPLIILAGGLITWNTLKDLPQVKKKRSQKTPSTAVTTTNDKQEVKPEGVPIIAHPLTLQRYQVYLRARSTAQAGEEIDLAAEADGKVMYISPQFEVGSIIQKGTVIARIDDADLRDALIVAQAKVAQAEASLAQEQVRAEQALVNWNELDYEEEPSDLVLRKPQLRQVQASLEAARSQVELAKRSLARVEVKAPIDGIVAERNISIGERAGKGRTMGRLISTEYSTLSLPVPPSLQHFLPPEVNGVEVTFRNALSDAITAEWQGFIVNRAPEVDAATKQLHLTARVLDPYSLTQSSAETLPVGQPVIARIKGTTLEQVYLVPQTALRGPNKIHIAGADNILRPLEITPLYTDEEQNIIFRADLPDQARWVESKLRDYHEGKLVAVETTGH